MESGVSIIAASHDTRNRPVLGHATGCRVDPDGRVILFLSRAKYPFLVDAIRRSGVVAASFNEPSTNRSIQVKGGGAELGAIVPGDAERIATYLDLFAADLERIHVRGGLARAMLGFSPGDLSAVTFTPAGAFTQTPGAQAGNPIGP